MGADGRDTVRIAAVIADQAGVMVPSAKPWLTFQAKGPARLLGTPILDAVWGMAAINALSTKEAGEIEVSVSSSGLKQGRCVITARPPK